MEFRELTDEQWEFVKSVLPPSAKEGRPRVDDRMTINAIVYVLTTGCRWMDLPKNFEIHYSNVWRRLEKWEEMGVWKRVMERIIEHGYTSGKVKVEGLTVDSTDVAAKKGGSLSAMTVTKRSRAARSMQ